MANPQSCMSLVALGKRMRRGQDSVHDCPSHKSFPATSSMRTYATTLSKRVIKSLERLKDAIIRSASSKASEVTALQPSTEGLSPILPPELWEHIFTFTAEDARRCFEYPYLEPLTTHDEPLRLARVCRLWRDIIFLQPRLWDTIALSPNWHLTPSDTPMVACLRKWLDRSGTLPASLAFNAMNADWVDRHVIAAVIELVNDYVDIGKIRAVAFYIPQWAVEYIHWDVDAALRPAPFILVTSNIWCQPPVGPPYPAISRRNVDSTPTLSVTDFILYDHIPVNIDWFSLTSLICCLPIGPIFCLEILRHCSRLGHLVIQPLDLHEIGLSTPHDMARLPNLIHCAIEYHDIDSLATVLGRVEMPNLQVLGVMTSQPGFNTNPPIEHLLARSGPSALTCLELACPGTDTDQLCAILQSLPSLTSLVTKKTTLSYTFFERLARFDSTTREFAFLPKLQTLHYLGHLPFDWLYVVKACDARMPDVVNSSFHGIRPLAEFRVHDHDGADRQRVGLMTPRTLRRLSMILSDFHPRDGVERVYIDPWTVKNSLDRQRPVPQDFIACQHFVDRNI